jgi:hypothetical protein
MFEHDDFIRMNSFVKIKYRQIQILTRHELFIYLDFQRRRFDCLFVRWQKCVDSRRSIDKFKHGR